MSERIGQVWAVCERSGDVVSEPSLALVAKAAELAAARGVEAAAVVPGRDGQDGVAPLFSAGADLVVVLPNEACCEDGATAFRIAEAAERYRPEIVLFTASIRGRSIAPQVATLLRTGLTADCTELHIGDDGLLVQTRPAFGNSLMARIVCAAARPQMASVRPGALPPPVRCHRKEGRSVVFRPEKTLTVPLAETLCSRPVDTDGLSLNVADVVLAGGMGLGRDAFPLLDQAARLFGAAAGATRAAVHDGRAPYPHQVGQTGVTVRPRLYLALGISGAVQHRAGMVGSGCIIAVNTDPKAPIFSMADYGIVADAATFLRALVEAASSVHQPERA